MNNGVFGKAIEYLRKRISFMLIISAKYCKRYVSKTSFVSKKISSKKFIHRIEPVLTLNKPIYVGLSILDLSRLLMYEFHYKYIKSKFNAKLLFIDTGSLVYEIKRNKCL